MTFEEYLVKKRISKEAFAAEDPALYKAWENMYAQMHPNSFYVAMKMVLNNVRLRYHLREEDVPKPATPTAPRPAARRAAPIPKTETETPIAIPAATDVSQETTEQKPIAPVTAPKPRPIVRRPAALQTPPVEGDTAASEKPAAEVTLPAAPRARPVIKRPVISKPASEASAEKTAETEASAPTAGEVPAEKANEADAPASTAEVPAETAKPVRPRPVIKRPAALQKSSQETGDEKPVEAPAAGIEPASSEAATEAPKPPRPRPVMKRPAALQKPVQEQDAEKPAEAAKGISPGVPDASANSEAPVQPSAEDAPKPPRPRPIIKRPAALSKPAAAEVEMNVATPEAKMEDATPVVETTTNQLVEGSASAPQADEALTNEKTPTGTPAVSGETGIEQPAKPPRPRPIMRRPAPQALLAETAQDVAPASEEVSPAASPELAQTVEPKDNKDPQETPADLGITSRPSAPSNPGITDRPSASESVVPEEQPEKPKPPRPRPIMRRPPPKTEE